jgi:hypothetical protein
MRSLIFRLVLNLRYGGGDGIERAAQSVRNAQRIEPLVHFISPGGIGAELGVHKGYFSRALLEHLAPKKLYLIDPWYLQGKYWSWGEGNRRVVDAVSRILRELEDDLAGGKAVLWIEDDLRALAQLPDRHLDWAYLDTTHQYDQTANELSLLKQKVKSGGIIAGDDWQPDPSHRHHGVCKAVREFVDREQCELIYIDEASLQWILRVH